MKRTNQGDGDEIPILGQALEDIELLVQPPAINGVENLRKDESIEDQGLNGAVMIFIHSVVVGMLEAENLEAGKMEYKGDGDLVNRLAHDLLVHVDGEQRCTLLVRFAIQEGLRSRVSGEGEGCERVHDDVDPQQLNSRKNGLFLRRGDRRNKSDNDGRNICGDLELQELAHRIIDTTTPHNSLDNR